MNKTTKQLVGSMYTSNIFNTSLIGLIAILVTLPSLSINSQDIKSPRKPNIVLVYIDDMGFSDISNYGEVNGNTLTETPHIDRLREEGMKFTNAYSAAPLCSPARAALLTGKSPARLDFEFVTKWEEDFHSWNDKDWMSHWVGRKLLPPPFTLNLPLDEITVAEALNKGGYKTAITGKWHVAAHYLHYKGWSKTHGPSNQGFDFAYETFGSHPYSYSNDTEFNEFGNFEKGKYPQDELTNKAIEFINQHSQTQPFFLYVSHYYVHSPIDTKAKWLLNKYRKKAGPKVSDQRIRYAAFIEILDHYVGQLLKAIDSAGIRNNTVVILTSDNGGHPEYAFNRPFRGSKWNLYEGGIRVPFIVRWPEVVKKGSASDKPIVQTDLMPTFRDLANLNEASKSEIDGKSLVSLLKSENTKKFDDRSIIWHFPYYHPEGKAYDEAQSQIGVEDGYISKTKPQSAIRKGNYKLIYFYEEDRAELYDLSEDKAEQNDLSSERPWDKKQMKEILFEKLYEMNARFPRKN